VTLLAVISAGIVLAAGPALCQEGAAETGSEAPWYGCLSIGRIDFEGNEELDDGFISSLHIGYDFSERWTIEGLLNYSPLLHARPATSGFVLEEDTYAIGVALDGLFHFTRWERLDPYLAAGVGYTIYGTELEYGRDDPTIRGGGGVMYHINDEWAVRADFRGMLVDFGVSPDANAVLSAGVCWYWGARVPEQFVAVEGPLDSDGDGLTDAEEDALGTDPYDPDTDKDRLSDGEEVNQYSTNPLEPDTDIDMLTDGDEVLDHRTNPLERDTDDGGVADGHEVVEDSTNPLDPSDDLHLFELYIQFDYDKAIIKPDFFPQLDVIGKVLKRNPGSTARIEGHADRTKKSVAAYNKNLSRRRAQSVLEYLASSAGIAKGRMEALGYGFERPKVPNDPLTGNPENRRVDVYIRGLGTKEAIEEIAGPADMLPEDK